MKWNKYTLKTTTQAEDFVSGVLMELGINGVQVEDNVQITKEEKEKFHRSCETLRSSFDGLGL